MTDEQKAKYEQAKLREAERRAVYATGLALVEGENGFYFELVDLAQYRLNVEKFLAESTVAA